MDGKKENILARSQENKGNEKNESIKRTNKRKEKIESKKKVKK